MFCQRALSQLAEQRDWIEAQGWQLVLVHLSTKENGNALHRSLGLTDVAHVSDPHAELFRAFQLGKSSLRSMLSPSLWKQSLHTFKQGYRQSKVDGDALQLPGAFVVSRGAIVSAHRASQVYEVPDLRAMASESALMI